jgi:class 3 adenylate cyclase
MKTEDSITLLRRLQAKREDNVLKILSWFYLSYAAVHVMGTVKGFQYAGGNQYVQIGFYIGVVVYLAAFYLTRLGYKNTGIWLFLIEQWIHSLIIIHFEGFSWLLLSLWYIAAVLIFLSNYSRTQKLLFSFLVLAFSLHIMLHGYYLSEVHFGASVTFGNAVLAHVWMLAMVTLVAYSYNEMVENADLRYEEEQNLSQSLLRNVLPESIIERLKKEPGIIVNRYDDVTILFADIVGFTRLSQRVEPERLVEILNEFFVQMDNLAEKYGLEKIKTIGDAYMVVGGLPLVTERHTEAVADMALELLEVVNNFKPVGSTKLAVRIGMNCGPVVAGVIGKSKFSYDLWGDAVNTAARMESYGEAGKIQVTEAVYSKLRHKYLLEKRGELEIKGKGIMQTYFLTRALKKEPMLLQ